MVNKFKSSAQTLSRRDFLQVSICLWAVFCIFVVWGVFSVFGFVFFFQNKILFLDKLIQEREVFLFSAYILN